MPELKVHLAYMFTLLADFSWLYSPVFILKVVLIVATSVLGLWEEIRKRFVKNEPPKKEGNKNKIYIACLIAILIVTVFSEGYNSAKDLEDSKKAKEYADSARAIALETASLVHLTNDSLKDVLGNARNTLISIARINSGINELSEIAKDFSQLKLVHHSLSCEKSFAISLRYNIYFDGSFFMRHLKAGSISCEYNFISPLAKARY